MVRPYNKKMREEKSMSKLNSLTKDLYLMILASIGAIATWFALMSTNSCTFYWAYQVKMPESLIKRD